MAKILHLECILERDTRQRVAHMEEIQCHSLAIASICLSPGVPDSVLIVAVNPLYYCQCWCPIVHKDYADGSAAGKYVRPLSVKAKIWALLSDIEARLGFHTRNRLAKLQDQLVEKVN